MHGRNTAATTVAELLHGARDGAGGALLVRGEPGMGASTLLESAADGFPGTVLRARGVAAETHVPFSGLHALLHPLEVTGEEPSPDPAALLATPPDDRAAAAAVRGVLLAALRRLSARGPVLVCVDDVHLLDPPSREVLGFTARRLRPPSPVAMLLVLPRDRAEDPLLAGLPEVVVPPLTETAAARLVDGLLPPGTDPALREALLSEGRGNPGLLTDMAARLADGTPDAAFPHPLPADGGRQRACAARLRALPRDTRRLLLLVAAQQEPVEPAGPAAGADRPAPADVDLLARAAAADGLDLAALAPAEEENLVRRDGDAVRFAHPLVRRAAYWDQPPAARRAAHRLLAEAAGARRRRLLRLWHLHAAASGPDPSLARALAEEARRSPVDARVRPGDALLAAARLTDDAERRAAHLAAAAAHVWADGRPHRARALLDVARRLPAAARVRGRAELLRGVVELQNGVVSDAREVLLTAARLLRSPDPVAAWRALLRAADACWGIGDIAGYTAVLDRMARLDGPARRGLPVAWRTGMAAVMRGAFPDARAPLRRVLRLAEREDDPELLILACDAGLVLGEVGAAREMAGRAVAAARARQDAVTEPQALERLVYAELRSGQHARAAAHARTGLALARRTGQRNCAAHHHAALAMVASVRGDEAACREHAEAAGADAGPHGLGMAATLAQWALARCDLGHGRPQEALSRLEPLVRPGPTPAGAGQGHFALRMLATPCFVEAAHLAGAPEAARPLLAEFVDWTAHTADPLAPAQLARCRALLAEDVAAAVERFDQALAAHTAAEDEFEQGRTQLLYGMLLRRRRRPREARGVLRQALVAFERCGADGWAEQARSELRATGSAAVGAAADGRPGRRSGLPALTPQQLRIARCVAEGATNREVAVRLSVSPRTVDHHLRNVFAALGVRSRVELTRVLAAAGEG